MLLGFMITCQENRWTKTGYLTGDTCGTANAWPLLEWIKNESSRTIKTNGTFPENVPDNLTGRWRCNLATLLLGVLVWGKKTLLSVLCACAPLFSGRDSPHCVVSLMSDTTNLKSPVLNKFLTRRINGGKPNQELIFQNYAHWKIKMPPG